MGEKRADKRVIVELPNGRKQVVAAGDEIPEGAKVVQTAERDVKQDKETGADVRTADVAAPKPRTTTRRSSSKKK